MIIKDYSSGRQKKNKEHNEKVEGKVTPGWKDQCVFVCLISQTSTQHGRQQAGEGTDGARSEGSSRLAASINQCHALEPHLCREACHWSSVLAFLCLDVYPVNTKQSEMHLIWKWFPNSMYNKSKCINFFFFISRFSITISFTGQVCLLIQWIWLQIPSSIVYNNHS